MIYMKEKKYTAIALIFQWVLLMQLFDALALRNQDCNSTMKKLSTRGENTYITKLQTLLFNSNNGDSKNRKLS